MKGGVNYLTDNWNSLTYDLPKIKSEYLNQLFQLYSSPKRHYHNLQHIEALLKLTEQYKDLLISPQTIQFTIWYHDAIYNASKNDNEEQSAKLAKEHLTVMGVNTDIISNCYQLILATKTHQLPKKINSFDAQFLLDIDLSILAEPKKNYIEYTKLIRQEYIIYPDFLYNKGRKKVLQHFLDSDKIFKTNLFYNLYEKKARINLAFEIKNL